MAGAKADSDFVKRFRELSTAERWEALTVIVKLLREADWKGRRCRKKSRTEAWQVVVERELRKRKAEAHHGSDRIIKRGSSHHLAE